MKHFTAIPLPNVADGNTIDMDMMEGLSTPAHPANIAANTNQGWKTSNKGKAPTSQVVTQPRQSEGDTSPERRAYSAPTDPNRIKNKQYNRFQPLAEEHSQESTSNRAMLREGSDSDAISSRGARMRDPIHLSYAGETRAKQVKTSETAYRASRGTKGYAKHGVGATTTPRAQGEDGCKMPFGCNKGRNQ